MASLPNAAGATKERSREGDCLLQKPVEIDNNRAERSIKPFVIGRKGWMFANVYLFEQMPNLKITDKDVLDSLMPWSPTIPDNCRVHKS